MKKTVLKVGAIITFQNPKICTVSQHHSELTINDCDSFERPLILVAEQFPYSLFAALE